MKKYLIYLGIILFSVFSFLMAKDIIPLFYQGVIVKYKRNTGPEFIVLEGNEYLKVEKPNGKNINFNELYSSQDLDSDIGYLSENKYIISGEIIGLKSISIQDKQMYPVMKINHILSLKEYQIKGIFFIIFSLFLFFLLYVLVKK